MSRSLFQLAADILEHILTGILFGVLLLHFHVLQLFLRVLQETVPFLPFAGDPLRVLQVVQGHLFPDRGCFVLFLCRLAAELLFQGIRLPEELIQGTAQAQQLLADQRIAGLVRYAVVEGLQGIKNGSHGLGMVSVRILLQPLPELFEGVDYSRWDAGPSVPNAELGKLFHAFDHILYP